MRDVSFGEMIVWFFFAPILALPFFMVFWLVGYFADTQGFWLWLLIYSGGIAGLFGLGLLFIRLMPGSEVDEIEYRWLWLVVALSTPALALVLWLMGRVSDESAMQLGSLSLFYSVLVYCLVRMDDYWDYGSRCVEPSQARTD